MKDHDRQQALTEDQRRIALEAFEGATGYDVNDPTCFEEVDLWLRSWELATEAAYERAAKIAKTSNFDDGPEGTIESQIARAILSKGDQP